MVRELYPDCPKDPIIRYLGSDSSYVAYYFGEFICLLGTGTLSGLSAINIVTSLLPAAVAEQVFLSCTSRLLQSQEPCKLMAPKLVNPTYSLHCSSFLGLPYRILIIYLVKPEKGTSMETIGKP